MRRLRSSVTATISISLPYWLISRQRRFYGQLIKEREKGRVVGKTRMVIFGEVDEAGIDTVYVERYNLTLRHGISRLVRKSLCFSKRKERLDNHLDAYQCYNNLIRVNSALTRDKNREGCQKHREDTVHG